MTRECRVKGSDVCCAVVQHRGDLEGEGAPIRARALDGALPTPGRSCIGSLALSPNSRPGFPGVVNACAKRAVAAMWGFAGGDACRGSHTCSVSQSRDHFRASMAEDASPARCWAVGAALPHVCIQA